MRKQRKKRRMRRRAEEVRQHLSRRREECAEKNAHRRKIAGWARVKSVPSVYRAVDWRTVVELRKKAV